MTLTEQFERLAAVEPSPYPVVSLYLNAQPNGHGRDQHQPFVRKELKARAATYPPRSGERGMLDRDLERISSFLESRVDRSANGIAIFACDALKLFETVQLEAPIDAHALVISDRPHLYPLARIVSRYPRYAVVLADTNRTRIVVVADSAIETDRAIEGVKTRRTSQGGSSQARFQRHIENYHLQHIKEVVAALEKIVLAEGITQIVVAGDEVALPLIREQLPKMLAAMVVDELSLAANAQPDDVVKATLAAMRAAGAETDRERVGAAVAAYRAGGLGVVGPDETLLALTNGQVDELLLTASLASLEGIHRTPAAEMAIANDSTFAEPAVEPSAAGEPASADMGVVRLADELVRKARQTSARLRIIEDPSLLEPFGGVAATLRYRV
jgi:peptide subunit release factor 1 (eRF1)